MIHYPLLIHLTVKAFTLSLNKVNVRVSVVLGTLAIFLVLGSHSCKSVTKSIADINGAEKSYRYAQFLHEGETIIVETYHALITKTSLGDIVYRQFYPEKNLLTKYVEIAEPNALRMSGRYIEWYDNGNYKVKGQCYEDQKEGEWEEYHYATSKLKAKGYYLNGVKEGEWQQYNPQGRQVANYFYKDGDLDDDYQIVSGGQPTRDAILDLDQVDRQPTLARFENLPSLSEKTKATQNTIRNIIEKNIKYPDYLRELKLEGVTETLITLNRNGSVKSTEVIFGICQPMAEESLRLAKLIDDWAPVTCDGTICQDEYRLFVHFKLD